MAAIIQRAESHKDSAEVSRKEVVGQTLPGSGPLPQEGARAMKGT